MDRADPDCCTETGTLDITRVRITPRSGNERNARLRITGMLPGASFSSLDPRQQEVSLLLTDGASTPVCCSIGEEFWLRLFRNQYGFWDKLARVCPPIQDVGLRRKRGGAGLLITTPHFDLSQLAGNDLMLTVRVGGSCATTTVALRRTRSGALVFP